MDAAQHAPGLRHFACCDSCESVEACVFSRKIYSYFRYVWLILSLNVDISLAIRLLKGKGEDGAVQRSRQRGWKSHAADEKARERKRTTGTTQAEDC